MHSCHRTILSQNVYFTSTNDLRKYLSVADVSSYSTRSLIIQKLTKKMSILAIFWSDTHISDAKMNPSVTFWPDIIAYLKHIGVQTREKKTCKTASGFDFL